MAAAAAAAAAAARRLTRVVAGEAKQAPFAAPFFRRMGSSAEGSNGSKVPTEAEMTAFVGRVKGFLEQCQGSVSEESFSAMMKDLSASMTSVARRNGALYETELANLVATFVPVNGTFQPHNSKVIMVDIINRLKAVERGDVWRSAAIYSVLTAFIGTMAYLPFAQFRLNQQDKKLKKDKELEEKDKELDRRVKVIEEKILDQGTSTGGSGEMPSGNKGNKEPGNMPSGNKGNKEPGNI